LKGGIVALTIDLGAFFSPGWLSSCSIVRRAPAIHDASVDRIAEVRAVSSAWRSATMRRSASVA